MATTLTVNGNGHFSGSSANITGYSVQEDATPVNGADNSGGVGQINFGVVENPGAEGTILLLNDTVELVDASNGRTNGDVVSVDVSDGVASITANSRLGRLVATRNVAPFTGTLSNAFAYYFSLAGITTGYTVDSTIASRQVSYVGFYGDIWDFLKQICTAQQIEISLVSSNIIVRPLRGRTAEINKNSSVSYNVKNGDLARSVTVTYYSSNRQTNGLIYPIGGWNPDVQVYQVDSGQSLTVNIPVNVSLESVVQPIAQNSVSKSYSGPLSVYAVAGNDGLPITAAQWNATGGKITVAIGEDTKSVDVTIVGALDPTGKYAPYRIAMSSGPSNYYSSLRLVGTGVFFNPQTLTFTTGVDDDKTANEIGVAIDSYAINSVSEAFTVGLSAAQVWAGADQTISVNATIINRRGDKGTANYPTFKSFNDENSGLTFAQFDTAWTGKTYQDFDSYWFGKVQDTFENQAFGNVAGARVPFRFQMYRIRSATTTESGIQYDAERDTTLQDFDAVWNGKTFAQFNSRWQGKSFQDFGVISLWT